MSANVAYLQDSQALDHLQAQFDAQRRAYAANPMPRLVGVQKLEAPAGWPSLGAFLADVTAELEAMHAFGAHPLQQSVRC